MAFLKNLPSSTQLLNWHIWKEASFIDPTEKLVYFYDKMCPIICYHFLWRSGLSVQYPFYPLVKTTEE